MAKLQNFLRANHPPTGADYWRVIALLGDGRVFVNVRINLSGNVAHPEITPFAISDVIDVRLDPGGDESSTTAPTEVNSTVPISPWDDTAVLISPNGASRATIFAAGEIAMGAPTRGTLRLNGVEICEGCNPSMVWSRDSQLLAIPQWTITKSQRLLIIGASSGRAISVTEEEFRVLQLERFEESLVQGIDSPVYEPRRISIPAFPSRPPSLQLS